MSARTTPSLSPPLHPHRSSKTSALTLNTLGRRRSTSCLHPGPDLSPSTPTPSNPQPEPEPFIQDIPSAPQQAAPSSMFAVIFSRCLEWLHTQQEHARAWSSTPPSPRSSSEEPVLPLSASATKTTFGPEVHEKLSSKSQQNIWWRQIHAPVLIVLLLFPASTILVLLAISSLPITFAWPRTVSDIAQLGRELHGYAQSGSTPLMHVMGVMTISAIWKHAWSVPGSVVWNVLAGALFSTPFATLFLTLLTTIGSVCATLLASPLAPSLTYLFPRALDMTRIVLEGGADGNELGKKTRSSAWVRLSVLRLVGVVPWSGINIACGVCGVAISDCFLGSFVGSLPWTAVTCQIGDILKTMAFTPSPKSQTISSLLTSPEIFFKLVFLSFLSLAPIWGRERLRVIVSNPAIITGNSEELSRWDSFRAWRRNLQVRLSHQPQPPRDLIQEKIALQELPS